MNGAKSPLWKQLLKVFLKLGVAALLIAWVIGGDARSMLESVRRMDPVWVAVCFCAQFLQVTLTGVRWKFLIAKELNVSWYEAMRLAFIGLFANIFIPAGAVGGDVLKAAVLASKVEKGRRIEATVSILVDRIVGIGGLFLLVLFSFCLMFRRIGELPVAAKSIVYLFSLLSAGGIGVIAVLFFQDYIFRWKFAAKLLEIADRWMKGIPGSIIRSVSAYRTRWKTLVLTTLFSALILHPLLFGALYFPLYGAMRELPPADVTLTASAYGNLASAVPVTPGGLGTRDAVVKTLLNAWGIPENSAVTAMVIYTAVLLLTNLLGGIAFLLPAEWRKKKE